MSITDEEILSMDKVSPDDAGIYLDKTTEFIRLGLKQQRLPFGAAVENPGQKWSYYISPGLLVAYKRGTIEISINH